MRQAKFATGVGLETQIPDAKLIKELDERKRSQSLFAAERAKRVLSDFTKDIPSSLSLKATSNHEIEMWVPARPPTVGTRSRRNSTTNKNIVRHPITFFPSGADSVSLSAIVEDCMDQLAILGHILPKYDVYSIYKSPMIEHSGRFIMEAVCAEETCRDFAITPEPMVRSRSKRFNFPQKSGNTEKSRRQQLRRLFLLNSRESELGKVGEDRDYLEGILSDLQHELLSKSTFNTLAETLKSEKFYKKDLQDAVERMKESDHRIRDLRTKLRDVKESCHNENEARNDMIAELKDKLQQLKIKCSMEKKYFAKYTLNQVEQVMKRNKIQVDALIKERNRIKMKEEQEIQCHSVMMAFTEKEINRLTELRDRWSTKYQEDTEEKSRELEQLKISRAKDLERMLEMTRLYAEYEQVVVAERIQQEKLRLDKEYEMMSLKAATIIQAWWRGTLVRKGLGPFRKKSKKKKRGKKKKKAKIPPKKK